MSLWQDLSGFGARREGEAVALLTSNRETLPCRLLAGRRHAMRGRLYYTAKAKKKGKVMIKVHPCSRLCFCRCWACFKEVTGAGIRGRGTGAGAPGLQASSPASGGTPDLHPWAADSTQSGPWLVFFPACPVSLLRRQRSLSLGLPLPE